MQTFEPLVFSDIVWKYEENGINRRIQQSRLLNMAVQQKIYHGEKEVRRCRVIFPTATKNRMYIRRVDNMWQLWW